MKHIDLLIKNNEQRYMVNGSVNNSIPDITIEFRILGEEEEDTNQKSSLMLEELYKGYFHEEEKKHIYDSIYLSYLSGKSEKIFSKELSSINLKKAFQLFNEKDIKSFMLTRYKKRNNSTIGGEGDFTIGGSIISLEYTNYKNRMNNSRYKTYEIKLSLVSGIYVSFDNEQKKKYEDIWIDSFLKLNALYFTISHNNDFSENSNRPEVKYLENQSQFIVGCFWCNMLKESYLEKLGGITTIKSKLKDFIVTEYQGENEEIFLHIKLCENFEDMTQAQLIKLKNTFLPMLPPINTTVIQNLRSCLEKLDTNSVAYDARKRQLNHKEFILKHILLCEEGDPRCV